ncbi:MAG TPA: hypothetical protein VN680_10360 [Burkholderiaceae bacterium]|jgi:hypothetical protein|nr:hypothetical protein [Burkholderiaceae bacterium]
MSAVQGTPAPGLESAAAQQLYMRYLRALALLCEVMPYVDEEAFILQIDDVLAEAGAHYPLLVGQAGLNRYIEPLP